MDSERSTRDEQEQANNSELRPPGQDPHHALNNPIDEPDPTEWPDPYEKREDPLDPPDPDAERFGEESHTPTGGTSTSQPHPSQDPEAGDWRPPERDRLDS